MANPRIDTADNLFAAALYRSAEQVDERLERTRYLQGAQKEVQMVAQDLFSGSPKARQKTPKYQADEFIEEMREQARQAAGNRVQEEKVRPGNGFHHLGGGYWESHVRLLGL